MVIRQLNHSWVLTVKSRLVISIDLPSSPIGCELQSHVEIPEMGERNEFIASAKRQPMGLATKGTGTREPCQ